MLCYLPPSASVRAKDEGETEESIIKYQFVYCTVDGIDIAAAAATDTTYSTRELQSIPIISIHFRVCSVMW